MADLDLWCDCLTDALAEYGVSLPREAREAIAETMMEHAEAMREFAAPAFGPSSPTRDEADKAARTSSDMRLRGRELADLYWWLAAAHGNLAQRNRAKIERDWWNLA